VIKLLLNKCIKSKDINCLKKVEFRKWLMMQNLALLSGWVFIQRKINNQLDISTLSTANTEKLKWKMKDERWKTKKQRSKEAKSKEVKIYKSLKL
jgi:hypothetical protein